MRYGGFGFNRQLGFAPKWVAVAAPREFFPRDGTITRSPITTFASTGVDASGWAGFNAKGIAANRSLSAALDFSWTLGSVDNLFFGLVTAAPSGTELTQPPSLPIGLDYSGGALRVWISGGVVGTAGAMVAGNRISLRIASDGNLRVYNNGVLKGVEGGDGTYPTTAVGLTTRWAQVAFNADGKSVVNPTFTAL